MTVWDLIANAGRRWVFSLGGALLTGLALFWVANVPPLYFEQVRVVLLPPASAQPNAYGYTSKSLIDLAGVVARELRPPTQDAQSVSGDVTLVGEGIRKGFSVTQQNNGGQWQYRFDEPVLEVQAVGATPSEVRAQIGTALEQLESTLAGIQNSHGVSTANRVRTTLNPLQPQLVEQKGSRVRAITSIVLTGMLTTLVLVGGFGVGGNGSFRRRSNPSVAAREESAVGVPSA
ncbi:hypothetical protein E3O19_02445 [Cryobacterium algoritolerans]|uniref:Polysaccharide chain length determinant N-terminal domain-containing protein n=1 Tax=Cryobacterium algoritolerans TaxID=1259184 RepID=A0A4R8WYX2_9MICO|nr:hypothetical protein [Cryobacterium algoritolerans]TFC19829.1 hypothetical protein E3O19_02445 [Cryobacterium algoritolerans]